MERGWNRCDGWEDWMMEQYGVPWHVQFCMCVSCVAIRTTLVSLALSECISDIETLADDVTPSYDMRIDGIPVRYQHDGSRYDSFWHTVRQRDTRAYWPYRLNI